VSAPLWTTPTYEAIARVVNGRAGLTLALRAESAEAGIRRAMARAGLRDMVHYRGLLEVDADAFDDLIVELTVGETYFFREAAHFAFIHRVMLPELRKRRGEDHRIRSWSAGCASGEEAYSLAMTFAEAGAPASVLATDISKTALTLARAATYGAWSLRVDGSAALRHLEETPAGYVVSERIRQMVTFEQLNLALDVYPSFTTRIWGLDLILCRNVLIYLDRDTVRAVARRLRASLANGGWLLTSASDPPLHAEGLEAIVTEAGVFYRRTERRSVARMASPVLPIVRSIEPRPHPPGPLPAAPPMAEAADAPVPAPPPGLSLARDRTNETGETVVGIRALANLDIERAERACAEANARNAMSPELRHLWALLLVELGRDDEAAREARRALFLDRSLAVAHFTLGAILHRHGDEEGARRAYRQARDLCAARPPDELVPLADGERCGRLAEAAEVHMALLGDPRPGA